MIKILLVDDHDLVRRGLSRLLSDELGIEIIGEVASGEEAITFVRKTEPDVILMDMKMPGMGGFETLMKINKLNPAIKIVILTMCETYVLASKAMQSGAMGYLSKSSAIGEIVKAIRIAYQGRKYLGSDFAQQLALNSFNPAEKNPLEQLSERELQVLLMLSNGCKIQEISDKLFLSPKTINSYRYRIQEKFNVDSDLEVLRLAMKYGLTEAEPV
ncbi:MAG: response regulator [Gammaproteobacteria bacterium]